MIKCTIDYEKILYPHDGSNLYTVIMQCVRDYSLKDKIISISFDNASNNTNCARRLKNTLKPMLDGKFLHTWCVCHIINLVVQIGVDYLNYVLDKFRAIMDEVYDTNTKQQAFWVFLQRKRKKGIKRWKGYAGYVKFNV